MFIFKSCKNMFKNIFVYTDFSELNLIKLNINY